jgi:hypothetical protein
MSLPIVKKRRTGGEPLPNRDALLKCFHVASTAEAANYMVSQFEKLLNKSNKFDELSVIFSKIKEYAKNVTLQREQRSDPWSGNTKVRTDFQNLQHNLAQSALENVTTKVDGALRMDFAINDNSELLRAFSSDGKSVDPAISPSLDTLFNSFLASNNLISKDSSILEATENGDVKIGFDGQPTKASPEQVSKLITEEFPNHLKKEGIDITIVEQNYPSTAAEKADNSAPEAKDGQSKTASGSMRG